MSAVGIDNCFYRREVRVAGAFARRLAGRAFGSGDPQNTHVAKDRCIVLPAGCVARKLTVSFARPRAPVKLISENAPMETNTGDASDWFWEGGVVHKDEVVVLLDKLMVRRRIGPTVAELNLLDGF